MKQTERNDCKTKYPILLIHGAGFRDLKRPVYWGRIPGALESRGAVLYYGQQDCWASVETNAAALGKRIGEILGQTGAEKVNLIAHSKGGLEARMAASSLGYGARIASITTIATPHHGSATLDRLMKLPRRFFSLAAFAVNNWIRLVGDKKPDFLEVCRGFTTERMERFNRDNPDVPGVFYQSYACVMSHPLSDINLSTANFVLSRLEGPNDGLVSVASASWGGGNAPAAFPRLSGRLPPGRHRPAAAAPHQERRGRGLGYLPGLCADRARPGPAGLLRERGRRKRGISEN